MKPLVRSPVFLMTVPRSGSTLLRCMLDSHPMVHAPHELHLTCLEVNVTTPFAELAMKLLGLDARGLEHLLWDRILHSELVRSGKDVIVEKDPRDLLQWERFRESWPDARFIFLQRHPAAIYASTLDSRQRARDRAAELGTTPDSGEHGDLYADTVRFSASNRSSPLEVLVDRIEYLDRAREHLPGLTVRYEELVVRPEPVTRQICHFLDIPWDARMLDYGAVDHGPLIWGVADSSATIRAGRIDPSRADAVADQIPDALLTACHRWGYR